MMFDNGLYTKVHEAYIEQMFTSPASQHYRRAAAEAAAKKKHKCKVQVKDYCLIR